MSTDIDITKLDQNLLAGDKVRIPVQTDFGGDRVDKDMLAIYVEETSGSPSAIKVLLRFWKGARGRKQIGQDVELIKGISDQHGFTVQLPHDLVDVIVENQDSNNSGAFDITIKEVSGGC